MRWGVKKIPRKATVIVLSASLSYCLLGCTVHFIGPSSLLRLRGSLCFHPSTLEDTVIIGVLALVLFSLPISTIVVVFSFLTIRYVKKNTIPTANLVKSVTRIIVSWTIFVSTSQLLPILTFVIRAHSRDSTELYSVAWLLIYAVEMSYPVFQLLVLLLHKTVRETFIGKCKKIRERLCHKKDTTAVETAHV